LTKSKIEVDVAELEARKQEDAQMLGASVVVVQMLIQRGKDKCKLMEVPDEQQARFGLLHPTT
jgi:hypothetical protein